MIFVPENGNILQKWGIFAQSGLGVMITIFRDFRLKNWRFSQTPML
jgi:hypothetical protein